MTTLKFHGYHPKHELPIQRGDLVRIPKGTMVSRLGTGANIGVKPAGRSYTVRVAHILQGAEYDDGPDGPTVINPKVVWAGTGGYWAEVDINDILEANP